MPTENRLLNEIENIINENVWSGTDAERKELALALYDLNEQSANEYYNTMKINKEEEGTTARFNHWAKNIYKK